MTSDDHPNCNQFICPNCELTKSDLERTSSDNVGLAPPPGISYYHVAHSTGAPADNTTSATFKDQAIQKLVKAGVKEGFATEVVENPGTNLNEIIKDPGGVLREYWYANFEETIEFLDDAVARNAEELKRGLRALQFQDSVVDSVYLTHNPRPDHLGHRDIFEWGDKLVTICLAHC